MTELQSFNPEELRIEPIDSAGDFAGAFYCASETFGRQTQDNVWMSVNPGWDTPQGQKEGAARLVKRWETATVNKNGDSNTFFLKATLPASPDKDGITQRNIVGFAIWQQASIVPGWGDPPVDTLGSELDSMDPVERRFAGQMIRSLLKRRIEYVKSKASSNPDLPAVFVLDLCVVCPPFQRKGIARQLVQQGLEEAKRRGGLEATLEGSSMGRHVYRQLGFRDEGDIEYVVDEEFEDRGKPSNIFMRNGASD